MPSEALRAKSRALENEFFAKRDAEKLAALRKEVALRAERQGLATLTGIPDETVLNHLLEVGVTAETLAAVALVLVAWADGTLSEKERKAVLEASAAHDVEVDGPAYHLLTTWLEKAPDASLRSAWHE